ncbi:MAG: VanZ family protein [Treponema sp.]|nr:VanZ family protein [Candidatus Treponema equifaecale]
MKFLKWIPSIFIVCCSFYLSSQEHIEHMPSFWNADKVVHFFCFSGFCFWTAFACNTKDWKKIWIPILLVSLWGVSDEIHQSFVPGRSASVFDWMADTLGATLGAVVYVAVGTKIFSWISNKFSRK